MKNKETCGFCSAEILRHPTKTKTYFCNTKCKANWQTLQRENLGFTKEWLVDQYFNQGKTCNDIAREIGRDSKRVWEWFKQYGIEVNSRGANWKNNLVLDGSAFAGKVHAESTKQKIRIARLADGHVPYLKGGKHWLKHDGAVHPNWKGGVTPERQSVYSSLRWSDAVKAVWKRDNATCQVCGVHQNYSRDIKFHIHHIESFAVIEKRCEVDNLVLVCPKCHRFLHSKKNTEKKFIK